MEKFSKPIKADEDAFYMSSPEIATTYLSNRLKEYKSAVELCSAVGMNCIALAKHMEHVYGIELDKKRIADAKYNASLYGVSEKIDFIEGNVLDQNLLKNIKAEIAILDPDWSIDKNTPSEHAFKIENTTPNLKELFAAVRESITHTIVARVSKNFSIETLNELGKCHVENIIYEGRIRFKYAYFSDAITENKETDIILDKE